MPQNPCLAVSCLRVVEKVLWCSSCDFWSLGFFLTLDLRTPRPATGVFQALRARSVPESVHENRGCPRECPTGSLRGPSGPGPQSIQKVSRECPRSVKKCPGHSRDTLGTLFGHSRARGPRALETPRQTLPRTPPVTPGTLSGTLSGTLRGHFGPEGPRDSCSRPGGSQPLIQVSFGRVSVWIFPRSGNFKEVRSGTPVWKTPVEPPQTSTKSLC